MWLNVLASPSAGCECHAGPSDMSTTQSGRWLLYNAGLGHVLLASASQDKYLRVWRIQPQATTRQRSASSQEAPTDSSVAQDIAR